MSIGEAQRYSDQAHRADAIVGFLVDLKERRIGREGSFPLFEEMRTRVWGGQDTIERIAVAVGNCLNVVYDPPTADHPEHFSIPGPRNTQEVGWEALQHNMTHLLHCKDSQGEPVIDQLIFEHRKKAQFLFAMSQANYTVTDLNDHRTDNATAGLGTLKNKFTAEGTVNAGFGFLCQVVWENARYKDPSEGRSGEEILWSNPYVLIENLKFDHNRTVARDFFEKCYSITEAPIQISGRAEMWRDIARGRQEAYPRPPCTITSTDPYAGPRCEHLP